MSDTQVTNNVEHSRFEIHTADGLLAAFAQYVDRGDIREFVHTVVKDEFEGQGIGGKIAREALDQTRADGLRVIATCPFIKGWIEKHPDYQDLLA